MMDRLDEIKKHWFTDRPAEYTQAIEDINWLITELEIAWAKIERLKATYCPDTESRKLDKYGFPILELGE